VNIVPDASVAVEVLLRTPLGERLAARLEGAVLVAPVLIDCEVLAVLRRLVLKHEIEEHRALVALDDLSLWGLRRLAAPPLFREAWSFRHNVSGYDAFYLAAAKLYDAAVLTIDGPLARAPRLGIVVENVRL
jgi:predicted nucleic acid-binding protein